MSLQFHKSSTNHKSLHPLISKYFQFIQDVHLSLGMYFKSTLTLMFSWNNRISQIYVDFHALNRRKLSKESKLYFGIPCKGNSKILCINSSICSASWKWYSIYPWDIFLLFWTQIKSALRILIQCWKEGETSRLLCNWKCMFANSLTVLIV